MNPNKIRTLVVLEIMAVAEIVKINIVAPDVKKFKPRPNQIQFYQSITESEVSGKFVQ